MTDNLPDLDQLIEMLGDTTTRESVPNSLHRIGEPAVDALLAGLQSEDENIRHGVIWAISRLNNSDLGAMIAPAALEPLTAILQQDEAGRVRLQALNALAKLATPEDYTALTKPLTAALDDAQEQIRADAAHLLAHIRAEKAVKPLRKLMENDTNTKVRGRAAYALAYLEPDLNTLKDTGGVGIDALLSALDDPERGVRLRVIWALGQLGNNQAVRPLTAILSGKASPQEKHTAAEALAAIGDSSVLEPLIMALQFDDEESVKRAAADALAALGDKRAVDVLVQSLRTAAQPSVRASAARALEGFADRSTADDLIAALDDTSDEVRLRAVLALGKIGLKRTLPALKGLLEVEENVHIRTAVSQIIDRLEG